MELLKVLAQPFLIVISVVFWTFLLRWLLGINTLGAQLDKVLEELKDIKYRLREPHPGGSKNPLKKSGHADLVPDEPKPDEPQPPEPTKCLSCGQTIPAESSKCPACGWAGRAGGEENS